MYDVKLVTNVMKDRAGQVQLQTEVKRGPTLTAVVQEVAPELFGACEFTLRAKAELLKGSEAEWRSRFADDDSLDDLLTLMAAWQGRAIVLNRWVLRCRLKPFIDAMIYVISPYLGLIATPACTSRGFVMPCGIILQFESFSRLSVAKIVTLFPESQHPNSWQEGFNRLSLLGDENTSTLSALYCLQDRFSKDMVQVRDKLTEEIQRADVTLVDCEAVWEYFNGQFTEFIDRANEGRWDKITEGLGPKRSPADA